MARRGKYEPLGEFLARQRVREVTLTPATIEQILGAPLPPSARLRAWWLNDPHHSWARAWLEAGWRTRIPPRHIASVTFVRQR